MEKKYKGKYKAWAYDKMVMVRCYFVAEKLKGTHKYNIPEKINT